MTIPCEMFVCAAGSLDAYTQFEITGGSSPIQPPKCRVCFTVLGCNNLPFAGATVTASDGPGPGGSGTTDTRGFVAIDVGAAGTYTITVNPGNIRYGTYSSVINLHCGDLVPPIVLGAADGYCCSPCCVHPLPKVIHITDNVGTFSATSDCLSGLNFRWSTPALQSNVVNPVCNNNCSCSGESKDGMVNYRYTITCSATGPSVGRLSVSRTWRESNCGGNFVPQYQYPPAGCSSCDGMATGAQSAGSGEFNCNNISASMVMNKIVGVLPDPVGGGVTISE